MRLPELAGLDADQLYLRGQDVAEFHSERPTATNLRYLGRLRRIMSWIDEAKPARVLDLGCAQGNYAILLAEKGIEAVATDIKPSFLAYARLKDDSGRIRCVVSQAYSLPFRSATFDLVFAGEIVEHVAYPERLLSECCRVLSSNGVLIAATPNGESYFSYLPLFHEIADRSSLSDREFGPSSRDHLFLFSLRDLQTLLLSSGLSPYRHAFCGSALLSSRFDPLMARLPQYAVLAVDRILSRTPLLNRLLCENLIIASRRTLHGSPR